MSHTKELFEEIRALRERLQISTTEKIKAENDLKELRSRIGRPSLGNVPESICKEGHI